MRVYVCSPFRGSVPPYTSNKICRNIRKTAGYCKEVLAGGNTPIAPHLFYANLLNTLDEKDRVRAFGICEELIPLCDELRVYGEVISDGMRHDISVAEKLNIPVVYITEKGA